jgi:hypothetical protein
MKCFSYLLVLSILFTSCDKIGVNNAGEDGFVTYKILKGQQSASPSQYKYYSSLMEQTVLPSMPQ